MMSRRTLAGALVGFATALLSSHAASSEDDADDLARKVSNPASFMISVPVHSDFDFGRWSDGTLFSGSLDIEPVIPFSLNADWNVISHTDFPLVYSDPVGSGGREFGLGDITQNFAFTPSSHGALIWAVGPQFSFPTATRDEFGSGKFSMGPSGLLLLQTKALSVGLSASQMWSVLGDGGRPDVNQSEVQPFVAWHIGQGRTVSANFDYSYDWTAETWSLPVSLSFSKIVKLGEQTVSLSVGGKYWIDPDRNGPQWGIKAGMTFLFPRKAPVQ